VFSEDEEEAVSSDSEPYYTGNGRRTRIRAAAMVANAMLSDMDRSIRGGRRSSSPATSEAKSDPQPEIEVPSSVNVETVRPLSPKEAAASDEKRTINDLMEARTKGLKHLLLYSLTKAVPAFYRIGDLAKIDWSYILQFQTKPWSTPYLQKLFLNLKMNKHHAIEHTVPVASGEGSRVLFIHMSPPNSAFILQTLPS